ncbi:MAG: hypothetical protein V4812_04390 [Pseudomonadota bacterium]
MTRTPEQIFEESFQRTDFEPNNITGYSQDFTFRLEDEERAELKQVVALIREQAQRQSPSHQVVIASLNDKGPNLVGITLQFLALDQLERAANGMNGALPGQGQA